ncbi:MAG: hypothetical protein ACE5F7_11490 [Nitrospiria bacterium]
MKLYQHEDGQRARGTRLLPPAALSLALMLSSLTLFMPVGVERHVLSQQHTKSTHADQHGTWICSWVCTALSFVHTAMETPSDPLTPSHERHAELVGRLRVKDTRGSLYIRGPPASIESKFFS